MPIPPDRSQTVYNPNAGSDVINQAFRDATQHNRQVEQIRQDSHVGSGAPSDPIVPRRQSGVASNE